MISRFPWYVEYAPGTLSSASLDELRSYCFSWTNGTKRALCINPFSSFCCDPTAVKSSSALDGRGEGIRPSTGHWRSDRKSSIGDNGERISRILGSKLGVLMRSIEFLDWLRRRGCGCRVMTYEIGLGPAKVHTTPGYFLQVFPSDWPSFSTPESWESFRVTILSDVEEKLSP
jgi:hypothetical protein